MFRSLLYKYSLICSLVFFAGNVYAQPMLPDMIGATDKGINVLSWNCQYDGLKFIAVQRSADSVFNYVTIGYVKNTKQGPQAYIDGHPLPGDNWYRLNIGFSSDLTWNSNRLKIHIDSATLLAKGVVPPNDSLQRYASGIKIEANEIVASSVSASMTAPAAAPTTNPRAVTNIASTVRPGTTTNTTKPATTVPAQPAADQYTLVKSQYVFTNPFTGHVTVDLPDNGRVIYSIKFFRQGNDRDPVMTIPRIKQKNVIIDKRNFNKKGIYKFILMEGTEKMDEGYITIY